MRNFFSIVYKQNNLFIHVCILLFSSMTSLTAYAYLNRALAMIIQKKL